MKRRFLALAMTLAMVFSLLPAGILTVSAEPLDVPSCDTLYDIQPGASISFESATNAGAAMSKGNNNTSLSLEVVEQSPGAAVQIANGYDATLGGIINDASERYIVLDMQIDKMPIWVDEDGNTKGPESGQGHSSTGFFIQARRPSVTEFKGEAITGNTTPFVHLAIVRMDEAGNLGFAVESANTVFMAVEPLGKKLGDNFELAIGWLSDYSFEIYCDDVLLQTYNIADMNPLTGSSGFTKGIRIGYNSYGSTADANDGYAVKLNVNSVSFGSKVQRSHPEIGKDGKCTVCGNGNYFDFTSYEIQETPINLSALTFKGTNNGIIDNAGDTIKITQSTIATTANDDDKLTSGAKPFDALVKDGEFFLTQKLVINEMPVFETTNAHPHARSATGYYVIVPVKMDSSVEEWGYFKICVYRIDDTDNLYVMNGTADKSSNIYYSDLYPLGVTLGDTFTLTAHIKSNSSMDLYCNGNFVHRFTNAQTITSSNNYNLFVGYKSNGAVADSEGNQATDIEVFSIATGERVAHEHKGGSATCTEQATCDVCGEKYGDLNANNHKPGINGVCTCGVGGYFDFTSYDIAGANIDFSTYTLSNTGGFITVSGESIGIAQTQIVTDTDKDANILKSNKQQPFDSIADGTELFLTQDIQINKMPVFTEFNHQHGRGATGYYTLVPVDFDTSDSTWNSFKICIYRIDNTDNLYVTLGTENYGIGNLYPLGVTLGVQFKLLAYMKSDGSMDLYCNGNLVHSFTKEESFTSTSTNNNYFIVGYKSSGAVAAEDGNVATDIKIYSIAAGERVAHEHKGGTATCTEQATCEVCGEKYGQTAPHTEDTAASCTTHATCKVCGDEYGVYADHDPDDAGICTECLAETGYLDLQYEYTEEDGTVVKRVTEGNNSKALMSLSKYGAAINAGSVDLISGNTPNYTAVIRNAFTAEAAAHHISQTVTITAMPAFNGATYINGYTATGYYNNLRRDNRHTVGNNEVVDNAMYSIYPNADGDLMVAVYTTSGWNVKSLNRELGEPFRLETVWDTDGSLSVFCDGYLVIKVADATYDGNTQGLHTAALSMGYTSRGANEDSYGTGAVNMSVSNIVISNGHIPEVDDGNCMTADVCSVCGVEFNEAKDAHVNPGDDDNCVTPVICSNPGCKHVFVEGHTLAHVDEVPATDDTTGTKEHWKCETEGCAYFGDLYLDEAGTQKVSEGELVISPNFEVSGDKSTVNTDYVQDAITNAGDGDVALGITTPEIELPSAALDALATSGNDLVITTSEGKVTLNAAAIAAIKSAAAENALSINVKKAGTSVLQDAQTAALSTYTAIKDVISAEMFGGSAITSFGEGSVIIEIPFELDSYGTAGDYKLIYVSDDGQTVEVISNAVFADGKVTATLEHFSDYAIVYTGELPQEPVEGNTTITSNGGSSYATVTGTYVDGLASGDVFSVNVDWDGLSFNYMAANTWDPETHTNTGGGWEEATGSVTVVNHSNVDVKVTVTKVDNSERNLGVVFQGDGNAELDTLTDKLDAGTTDNVNSADSFVVTFKPDPQCKLVEGDTDVTLATITVRIEKYDEETQN